MSFKFLDLGLEQREVPAAVVWLCKVSMFLDAEEFVELKTFVKLE